MTIRTEQTLRRMWDESLKLAAEGDRYLGEHTTSTRQADEHDRAAAADPYPADPPAEPPGPGDMLVVSAQSPVETLTDGQVAS